jgi:thiol-disulfide isomerase/thioredoxin
MTTVTTPLIVLLSALGAIALGLVLRRASAGRDAGIAGPLRFFSAIALCAGFGATGLLAFVHLTGRLGPAQLWFRAPTFYVAALTLAAGAAWWFSRRDLSSRVRFGFPAAAAGVMCAGLLMLRATGASTPLAMLMPTLERPAPDLTYFDTGGRLHRLSELRGKVVLLNFWATWCAPCRREMPLLAKMQRAHAKDGLVVLYVSLEEPDVLADFLRTQHFDGIQGRLDSAPAFYDAGEFYPLSYLIGREGRVEKRWSGRPAEDWLQDSIRRSL